MRLARAETTPFTAVPPVRGGTIAFKTLLEGRDGSPDNYQLVLADTDVSFQSPRHRHNFDQFRLSVQGATNIGPKRNLEEGDLAYFPEGTYYGPQTQQEVGSNSLCMVIQFGGPSGNGYMSRQQMQEGFARLGEHGRFEDGVYRRAAPAPDGRMNQDAYEAIWEHMNGRPVSYSKPRFLDPVHVREPNFEWQSVAGAPGAATKQLGSFTEKGVGARAVRVGAGSSLTLEALPQLQIVFIKDGTGQFGNGEAWSRHTAVELAAGESATMNASTDTEAVVLALTRF
jgi:hypothetical protein